MPAGQGALAVGDTTGSDPFVLGARRGGAEEAPLALSVDQSAPIAALSAAVPKRPKERPDPFVGASQKKIEELAVSRSGASAVC